MTIRVLSPQVAAGIAAGEVIERPASVVKELVDNALDAGATSIDVELRQGGLESIRVADNGCGIDARELAIAFQRHATSKLQTLDELDSLATLGFRGEALPSIAAAAHVRMVARPATEEMAAFIEIEGGRVLREGREAAAPGTSVLVEALFSTIPARLKFMRSVPSETGRVRQVVDHAALAFPHVRFSLRADRRALLQTSGNGFLRDVAAAVYGAELAGGMIDVEPSARAVYQVHGLAALPEWSRPNMTGLSVFVNGRWIINRAVSAAIEEAYTGLLMEGRHPLALVFIEVPPGEVDVNVHPNKREVRFAREPDAFASVQRSVRESLLACLPMVEARGSLSSPASSAGFQVTPSPAFRFTIDQQAGAWAPLPEPSVEPHNDASAAAMRLSDQSQPLTPSPPQEAPSGLPALRVIGQVGTTYVVAEGSDGMYLIDQHAAHESILYYRLLRQWDGQSAEVQPMLEPLAVDLTPDQAEAVSARRDVLERYGLHVEPFGDATWLIRAVPAMSRRVDAARLLAELLADAPTDPDVHLAVAASLACHSAVRAGQSLDIAEMRALAEALAAEGNPPHCPHGRPVAIRISMQTLEREFGRT